ncbi:TetM/TetW/TetO/TetS family tetracycline resistance ribosomal protection protein [soil metagenome]
MAILNIGILAHVDAGKTTLTERLLFETGVIPTIGSVDKGTTQTDTMALERARGITIKSAVVSFQLGDLKVNLIDTPGHGDFIAEVQRSLRVLDAVVLVVSAVEGVQSQTRRLAAAIRAAKLPLIVFVNKIDRIGARGEALLDDIQRKLGQRVVAMNRPTGLGDRRAAVAPLDHDSLEWREPLTDLLAEVDERVIEAFERNDGELDRAFLETTLREHVGSVGIAPVYFGAAITGVGVRELLDGIREWLPAAERSSDAPLAASVFKITRQSTGEKIVYARVLEGNLAVRQQVKVQRRNRFGAVEVVEERITGVDAFTSGSAAAVDAVHAGDIAALHGLRSARIGDFIGEQETGPPEMEPAFPAPALESIVRAGNPAHLMRLRTALEELAEQDPLISLRQRNEDGKISVRLYGEVQKEVLQETLLREYGIDATFGPSRTICVERVIGTGEHIEIMGENGNPIMATVGVRIEATGPGSGIQYRVREMGSMPPAHYRAVEETVYETLSQGLYGWDVTDCVVILTEARTVQYSSPTSTAGDFRKLTPLVVMQALAAAGTEVCEPIQRLDLDIPQDTVGAVCGALIKARGTIQETYPDGAFHRVVCEIPTAEIPAIGQQLPRLTRGEGNWESTFLRYEPVSGDPPARNRVGPDPTNRTHYLTEVA